MLRRIAENRLMPLWSAFPAVLVLGARQVGKTTLARAVLPEALYCDLEEPGTRELFSEDPTYQIESREERGGERALILDEAQAVPEVFSALRGIIDRERSRNGRFLLMGSAQPSLVRGISETLTGRVGVITLDPLTAIEVSSGNKEMDYRILWLRGGFPDALRGDFRTWWESYLSTFLERDLPYLGVSADPLLARRLLTYLAHAQGGLFNASEVGRNLGVSYHTIHRYISIFERTFLVRRLPPYFRNIGKRLVRSPKIYLRDTGLLHHLLNVSSIEELESHPKRGASWETFVLEDLLRRESVAYPHSQPYFWRTAAGAEIDLLLERGQELFGVELKVGRGSKAGVGKRVGEVVGDVGANAGWILDQSKEEVPLASGVVCRGYPIDFSWLPK